MQSLLLTEGQLCGFCTDQRRDDRVLCVVEGIADLMARRRRGSSRAATTSSTVLHTPEGIGPEQARIQELLVRLEDGRWKR